MGDAELRAIEDEMVLRVDTELLRDRKSGAIVKGNRASEIGHECMTWHLLRRLRSDLAKPKNLGMKKRFHIGTALERPNMRLLQDAGLDVMESQEPLDWATGNLSGHMDARIGLPKIGPGDYPLEGKTAAPSTYRMIKKIYDTSRDWHDLLGHKFTYLRAYPAQLQAYELLYNKEWGCWFFFEKASGDYFFWIVPLDYEYAETLVKRAEAIEALVKSGTIPAAIRCDECVGCDYTDTYCFVGKDLGPGYDLLLSAEEIAMWEPRIERALELKPFSQEYDDLMDEIKEAFKGRITLIGKYLVRSKAYSTTSYKVPREIKAPYAVEIEGFRLTIETL